MATLLQTLLRHAASSPDGNIGLWASQTVTPGFADLTEVIWPVTGSFRNLAGKLSAAPGVGTTRTLTLYINGAATALTCTFGAADTTKKDTTNVVTIVAGQRVRLVGAQTGSPAAATLQWSVDFESWDAYSSGYATNFSTNQNGYVDPFTGRWDIDADDCKRLIPCAGTLTALYGTNTSGGVTAGNYLRLYWYKNGVKQDGTGGTVNTELIIGNGSTQYQAQSKLFTLNVVRGDEVYIGIEETGTYPNSWTTVGARFEASNAGESILASFANNDPSASAANFIRVQDDGVVGSWSGTNNLASHLTCGPSSLQLKAFICEVSVDPGATKTRVFELMSNTTVPTNTPSGTISSGDLDIDDGNVASFVEGDIVGPLRHTPSGTPTVTGREWWSYVMVAAAPVPSGGGGGGGGTNPAVGNLPTVKPIGWVYVKLTDGTVLKWSESWTRLSHPSTFYGGEKAPRLRNVSEIRREMNEDGAIRTYRWTVDLDDNDGAIRAAIKARTLKGAYIGFFLDEADHSGTTTPYRAAGGLVVDHELAEPMRVTLTAMGALGRKFERLNQQAKVPNHVITNAEFPGIDPRRDGQSVHTALGVLSDESKGSLAEGVVPWQYMGYVNLLSLLGGSAANVDVDAYLLTEGACGYIYNTYFLPPQWKASRASIVGDLVRPTTTTPYVFVCTVAGTTGSSEPTWPTGSGATVTDGSVTWSRSWSLDVQRRIQIPLSVFGSSGFMTLPFMPNWGLATGKTTNYLDIGGRRYTLGFVVRSHPYAATLREGEIASNVIGLTDTADGLGSYLSDPVYQALWVLVNEGFGSIDYTAYASMPTFDAPDAAYSYIDTASFDAAKAVGDTWLTGGVVGGLLLGRNGQQQRLSDTLRDLCQGGFFDLYENRHGQISAHRHDPSASIQARFTARDILPGSVRTWVDSGRYFNHLRMRTGYRYAKIADIGGTPASDWVNDDINLEDTTAQTDTGEVVTLERDNYVLRDVTVATAVGQQELDCFVGPAANKDGRPMMSFEVRCAPDGLVRSGHAIDLGSRLGVTHPEARVATEQTLQVRAVIINGLRGTVRYECRVLEA